MSDKTEDTNSNPVATGEIVDGKDTSAAKSNAENDSAVSPADASTAEGESKSPSKSYLPKFPFRFKGRNDPVTGSHIPPDPKQVKTGGSSVQKPQGPKLG